MKILLLGGTGAMGSYLAPLLSDDGIDTFVTSRKIRESKGNINYIQGDAHDIEFLKGILAESWDVIIDFMVYSTLDFKERVDLLLDNTNQYVFLSSSRVYADSSEELSESSPRLLDISKDKSYLDTDEYALTKALQENILTASGKINWTIIRPYITYSKDRLQLGVLEKEDWLYRALNGRTIVFSKDIYSKFTTMTHGLDVARGIKALINNSSAFGETVHITSKESNEWSVILEIYLSVLEKKMGYRPKFILQDLSSFIECKPAEYQIIYDRLFNRKFGNDTLSLYIDNSEFTKVDIGIDECLSEFIENAKFNDINWKLEALKDRLTKERTSLKEILGLKQKAKYLIYRYLAKEI
ncbi:epimerase [Vibrio splendidus]|uniref:NAD-dependent epimerase/dehydratase family protein n=1 Tax=Vibrio splendidus TaxID=29497 RepID=UPI000D39132B|nr:NAD-dependent epimerase/dehydratase family protein [Vibrio splendidus]PTP60931.1 epimerase [Vibrio splendidus]